MPSDKGFKAFVRYLESLAEQHKAIRHKEGGTSHFIRLDTDELDNGVKQAVGFPLVCLDRYSASLAGGDGNPVKRRGITLMVLDNVPDTKDYDRIHDTWDRCEAIADDLVARIYRDTVSGKAPGMLEMDLSSVEYELAGNRSLALYGAVATFTVTSAFCLRDGGNFESVLSQNA